MRWLRAVTAVLVLSGLPGLLWAPGMAAQSAKAPPHLAGDLVYQGPNFSIHTLRRVTIRKNDSCAGGRYPMLNLQVVFDVPDDFQLDEDYLVSALPYSRLREIADRICPDAVIIGTSHFFKDRFIGQHKQITDAATVARTRSEMAFSSLTYSQDSNNEPVYSNRLRINGRSWDDVKAFNDAGFKTEDQLAYERERERERQMYQARSDRIGTTRDAYFTERKAALRWPSGDNWTFDVYMRGHGGTEPPPRSPEQRQSVEQHYPSRDGMLLAYVEEAQRQCGAVSPNGTEMIGFTLTNELTGSVSDSQAFPVDRKLYDAYRAAKLSGGAYNVFSLSQVKSYQNDLRSLFGLWACDGPEFGDFIEGILKTDD